MPGIYSFPVPKSRRNFSAVSPTRESNRWSRLTGDFQPIARYISNDTIRYDTILVSIRCPWICCHHCSATNIILAKHNWALLLLHLMHLVIAQRLFVNRICQTASFSVLTHLFLLLLLLALLTHHSPYPHSFTTGMVIAKLICFTNTFHRRFISSLPPPGLAPRTLVNPDRFFWKKQPGFLF